MHEHQRSRFKIKLDYMKEQILLNVSFTLLCIQ